ncbi:DUF4073 domain-containing protein [Ureibacillus acetophenoni]|uniref:S-layer family protein n=1 Tax=Ureibacillus acetophenoni TaxID=614649 RepID=A0A285TYS3_9BACL|nr:DUF4073 domain-containing protein [Ureibacillus acetophenoni]SOC34824.1 S-layer family protein [Ureibacillus acetophenoni]
MSKKYKIMFTASAVSVATVASIVAIAPTTVDASMNFPDVTPSDYFYEAVTSLAERNIINGYPDGKYHAEDVITRGQAAKIIAGVLGLDTENVTNPNFTDVPKNHPFYGEIATLANAGIIDGYNGKYLPNDPIIRDHMAKIIANAFQLESQSTIVLPFNDVHASYQSYIAALYENEITTGTTPTTFDGNKKVSRGEMAVFVTRAEASLTTEIELIIENISHNTIQSNEGKFTVASELSTIFKESNEVALKGARVTATVKNGSIVSIQSITLNESGQSKSPVIFDGGEGTIDELIVNADFVSIQSLNVAGNITLSNKVTTEVVLNKVTSNGQLLIESADTTVASLIPVAETTTGPKITLNATSLLQGILAKRDNVAIISDTKIPEILIDLGVSSIQVDGEVGNLTVNVDIALEITGNATIDQLAVAAAAEIALEIQGIVRELLVQSTAAKLEVGTKIDIEQVILPTDSKPENVISNYQQIKDKISKVVDTTGSTVQETSSPSGDGLGGDDGGSKSPVSPPSESGGGSSTPVDRTPPTITIHSTIIGEGDSVYVKSNEIGTVYLVPNSLNPKNKSELDKLVNASNAVNVTVQKVERDINIPTLNLTPGEYKVIAVDNSGNLSTPKQVTIIDKVTEAVNVEVNNLTIDTIITNSAVPNGTDSYKITIIESKTFRLSSQFIETSGGVGIELSNSDKSIFTFNISDIASREYTVVVLFFDEYNNIRGYEAVPVMLDEQTEPTIELYLRSYKTDYLLEEEFDYEFLEFTDKNGNQIDINEADIQIIGFDSSDYITDQKVTVKVNGWSKTILVSVLPAAPNLILDDILDVIVGMDSTMEYKIEDTDNWIKYDENNPPDLSGEISITVRYSATNEKPPSHTAYFGFSNLNFLLDEDTKNGNPTNSLSFAWHNIDQLDESTIISLNGKTLDNLFYENQNILHVLGSKDIKITGVTWNINGDKLVSAFTLEEPINMKEAVGVSFSLRSLEELNGWVGFDYVALYKATDSELLDLLVEEIKLNELDTNGNSQEILLYMSTNRELIHSYNQLFALYYIEEITSSIDTLTDIGKLQEIINKVNVMKNDEDQITPTDSEKVAIAKTTIQGLNIAWDTDAVTTVTLVNQAIEGATLPDGVIAVAAEGTAENIGNVVITISSGVESDIIVIAAPIPTQAIKAVNNADDVTSFREAIDANWEELGISEEIKNNFMALPEDAGRQKAVFAYFQGEFADADTIKEVFEYAVNQEFHKFEFINAVDGANSAEEMKTALTTYIPTLHADRVELIADFKAKGMTAEAEALEITKYTTVLATVNEMVDDESLLELAKQLLEKRLDTTEKAFFGTENIVNAIQEIINSKGVIRASSTLSMGVNFTINNGILKFI